MKATHLLTIILPVLLSSLPAHGQGMLEKISTSQSINAIYRKWFEQAIPPKGINLNLPIPYMLRDSFKYPSDKVADLEG
jgi:hypothetical protein